jgi:hypothetical protein
MREDDTSNAESAVLGVTPSGFFRRPPIRPSARAAARPVEVRSRVTFLSVPYMR